MIDDLAKRDFIVFAGAGASMVTGIKKWRELLGVLNRLVALKGVNIEEIDPLHFPEIAQMIYDRLENDGRIAKYYEAIQECMKPTQCSWVAAHQKIIRASSSIVTTNIDSVFEKAISDAIENQPRWVPSGQRLSYQTLENLDVEKTMDPYSVTYLHGRCDKKEMILKTCDYFKYYRVRNGGAISGLEKVLKDVFCRREGIVFVGFSFGDRFVLETFERGFNELKMAVGDVKGRKDVRPEDIKHYAFFENPFEGGLDYENWLIEKSIDFNPDSTEKKDAIEAEKLRKHERRLRDINIEVIRYEHDKHIEIESYFEGIYNNKRRLHDFPGNEI